MDTTPKYVKMCERTEEIQKIYCEIVLGNNKDKAYHKLLGWYVGRYNKNITPGYSFIIQHHNIYDIVNWRDSLLGCAWLPRQDQLQETIKDCIPDKPTGWEFWFDKLHDFIFTEYTEKMDKSQQRNDGTIYRFWIPETYEQLWLAFVMHEKYGKHWDNKKEEWVKQ